MTEWCRLPNDIVWTLSIFMCVSRERIVYSYMASKIFGNSYITCSTFMDTEIRFKKSCFPSKNIQNEDYMNYTTKILNTKSIKYMSLRKLNRKWEWNYTTSRNTYLNLYQNLKLPLLNLTLANVNCTQYYTIYERIFQNCFHISNSFCAIVSSIFHAI